jgi:phage-related protein
VSGRREIEFRGSALDDLRAFPIDARQRAGHQMDLVQQGSDPDHWKPMTSIGKGVREIRVQGAAGAFRVFYIATLADAVYVLHAFQKKAQQTARADIELGRKRYRELVEELNR